MDIAGADGVVRRRRGGVTVQSNKGRMTVAEQVHGSVSRLVAVLATMEPVDDDFPDVDEGLPPLNPGPDFSFDAGPAP